MGFIVIKRRSLVLFLCAVVVCAFVCVVVFTPISAAFSPKGGGELGLTVVLDAGHGGVDGGDSGVNSGTAEAEINLAITKKLESYLVDYGFSVVLTRKNSDGLYGSATKNLKMADLRKRAEIIGEAKPALVLSIHCNSFPSASVRGAQMFYSKGSVEGKAAAIKLQRSLKNLVPHSDREAIVGDYFILECSPYLSLIAECGFLSNPEDDALLNSSEHQQKLAYALFLGIMSVLLN